MVWGAWSCDSCLSLLVENARLLKRREQIAFNLSHLLIKLSYFAFYLRLMPERSKRLVVYGGAAFTIAVGITYTTLSIFMCTPVERGWDKSVPGTCVDSQGFLLSNAALNMVADIIVFLMPVPALWSLQREAISILPASDGLGSGLATAYTKQFPCGNAWFSPAHSPAARCELHRPSATGKG